MDLPQITTIAVVSGTATITTVSSHGLTTGAYVQIGSVDTPSTALNTVAQVTATSGTTFTYTTASGSGTASGTAAGSAFCSVDLLNPLSNYASGTARQYAMTADISRTNLVANGDGSGATMSLTVLQEQTPSVGPWFTLVPDQTRFRFATQDTGSVPGTADVRFLGTLASVSSRLNGSGLGLEADVTLADVNTMLDRVMVYGKTGSITNVESASRSGGTATIKTTSSHGFSVGQKVTIAGVSGGGTASFNTASATVGTVFTTQSGEINSFKYVNAGANTVDGTNTMRYTVALDGKSRSTLILTAQSPDNAWVESNQFIWIFGSTISLSGFSDPTTTKLLLYGDSTTLGKPFTGANVTKISSTSFRLALEGSMPGTAGAFTGAVRVQTSGRVWDGANTSGQTAVIIKAGVTETNAAKQVLSVANGYHGADYPMRRLIDTGSSTLVSSVSVNRNSEAIYFPSCSLRSALDTVIENWMGYDLYTRRYYVNPQAQLVYEVTDVDQQPTYATAPYKIITTGAGSPNTTTAAATIAPYNLSVAWDHDTIKRAQFNTPSATQSGGQVSTVLAYGNLKTIDGSGDKADRYPNRPGAPITETQVDFPTAQSASAVQQAAAAWFRERKAPMLSGYFELRGAGTAAHNTSGFLEGYAQTGASTFALTSWAPGQWVDITAAGLGLSGKYRVEEVSLSFEPGSYTQIIGVTFNRKSATDLAAIIAAQKG
jgi:hypothetical protein